MNQEVSTLFDKESYLKIFTRFLRYGFLAWGGPIGQLALIEKEMVHEQKLISIGYFNRLLAIYQAIPGPETHEICVHLGAQAKGWFGGVACRSWLYVTWFFINAFLFMVLRFIWNNDHRIQHFAWHKTSGYCMDCAWWTSIKPWYFS